MSKSVGNVSSFDVENGNWQTYSDRLDMYFLVNKVEDNLKLPTVISVIGDPAYELMVNLCSPKKPCECTYKEVMKLMSDYLQPQPSVVAERFKFRQCRQSGDQSILQYVGELKKMTKFCDFGTNLDENMRDQFVCGIKSDTIRQRLFAEDKLNYNKAIKIATTMEAAERDSREINSNHNLENTICGRRDSAAGSIHKLQPSVFGCRACGDNRHRQGECKFRTFVCDYCGEEGHLKRVCPRADIRGYQPSLTTYRGARRGAARGARRGSGWPRSSSSHGARAAYGPPRQHWLGDGNEEAAYQHYQEPLSEETGEIETQEDEFINQMSLSCYKPVCITLLVDNQPVEMELDTGSALSCINSVTYSKKFRHLLLHPCKLTLKFYDGSSIRPLGYLEVDVEYLGQRKKLDLYVIDKGCTSLLGRQWLAELNMKVPMIPINKITDESDKNVIISKIISRHKDLFEESLGRYTGGKASLYVREGATPIFCRARPLPYAVRARVDAELDAMLAAGVIEPVDHSDWATPLVIARKADGGIRICADYKVTLNRVLLADRYPVPKIEDLFTNLGNNRYFTKLDLSHAYNQYELDDASKRYTVINTHRGLFKYNRLVYGLSSSPGLFQKMMQSLLCNIPNVVNFLDDILITGTDLDSHIETIQEVFRRLQQCGLKLKKNKCVFLADRVKFLGYIVDKDGLRVDPDKIKPILEMTAPKTVSELRSFLGMVNFYGKFVKNLSSFLGPLYELLRKGIPWYWGRQQQLAFERVKRLLTSTEVLVHFDMALPSILTCDASAHGLGALLAQRAPDGSERVVAYASRSLTPHEVHYSQIHKEALAIVFAVNKFHQYLYGRKFVLRTDHKPLVSIFGPTSGIPITAASRLQRWAVILSAYEFSIEYISTEKNTADALSRMIKSHKEDIVGEAGQIPEQTYLHFATEAMLLDYNKLKKETEKDPIMRRVLSYIRDGWPTEIEIKELSPYINRKNELYSELGCILWGHRVVIPSSCREKVLRELHDSHMGMVKTKSLARSYVWWPGLDEAIEAQCRACEVCAALASAPPARAPRLWPWPEQPWARLHIDFLGPIGGFTYFIVVDAGSKWIEAIKMQRTSAFSVIRVIRQLWARFGIPKQVVSDNGPPFTSVEFQQFLSNNGVEQVLTAPYHPASNGAAESAVKICKNVLKKAIREDIDSETALDRFLLIYRNTEHSATGESPAKILQGRPLRTRLDCLKPERSGRVRAAQVRQERGASGTIRQFHVGDTVWYRSYRPGDRWLPGLIVDRHGETNYRVESKDGTGRLVHRHIDQLKVRVEAPSNAAVSTQACGPLVIPVIDEGRSGTMDGRGGAGNGDAGPEGRHAAPAATGSPSRTPATPGLPADLPDIDRRYPDRDRRPPIRFGIDDFV